MLSNITAVWGEVAEYIVTLFPNVTSFFYNATTHTLELPGVMACVMSGVALLLLVFNLIRSFLPMRG